MFLLVKFMYFTMFWVTEKSIPPPTMEILLMGISGIYIIYIYILSLSIHRHLVECYCQRQGRECEHQALWLAKHPFLEENHIENP